MKALVFLVASGLVLPSGCWSQCAGVPASQPALTLCHALSSSEIEEGIRRAAKPLLSDPSENTLQIEVLDQSHVAIPESQVVFTLNGTAPASPDGTSVLHGHMEGERIAHQPVWARVRMKVRRAVLVAKQDLDSGQLLTEGSLEEAESWIAFPESSNRRNALRRDAVTNARLKRSVRKGEAIQEIWLDYPLDIRRGQVVELHVQSGTAHLRLQAVALTNARNGEDVEVRLSDRGPGLSAIADGPGRALLEARRLIKTNATK